MFGWGQIFSTYFNQNSKSQQIDAEADRIQSDMKNIF